MSCHEALYLWQRSAGVHARAEKHGGRVNASLEAKNNERLIGGKRGLEQAREWAWAQELI